jgi:chromosome segregation ATPase
MENSNDYGCQLINKIVFKIQKNESVPTMVVKCRKELEDKYDNYARLVVSDVYSSDAATSLSGVNTTVNNISEKLEQVQSSHFDMISKAQETCAELVKISANNFTELLKISNEDCSERVRSVSDVIKTVKEELDEKLKDHHEALSETLITCIKLESRVQKCEDDLFDVAKHVVELEQERTALLEEKNALEEKLTRQFDEKLANLAKQIEDREVDWNQRAIHGVAVIVNEKLEKHEEKLEEIVKRTNSIERVLQTESSNIQSAFDAQTCMQDTLDNVRKSVKVLENSSASTNEKVLETGNDLAIVKDRLKLCLTQDNLDKVSEKSEGRVMEVLKEVREIKADVLTNLQSIDTLDDRTDRLSEALTEQSEKYNELDEFIKKKVIMAFDD